MPEYLYQHPETQEVKSVFQSMNEKHEYKENGVKWNRVFSLPQFAISTKYDAFSTQNFLEKTQGAKTIGEVIDRSQEWSENRKSQAGNDPILEKSRQEYRKKWGAPHPSEIKRMGAEPKII